MILKKAKDGGPQSPVDGYFLCEFKSLFSIVLLKFTKGRREEFHTHAFNALTWFISGELYEEDYRSESLTYKYRRSLIPKYTSRNKNHRVLALKDSWCISIRGPWAKTWTESNKTTGKEITLTHGRKVI